METLTHVPLWQQIFGWALVLVGVTGMVRFAVARFRRDIRRQRSISRNPFK